MTSTTENPKKRSYTDTLSDLTGFLSDQHKDLEAREAKLRKERDGFEKDRLAVYGDTSPGDVLDLNVGGTKISVSRKTLTLIPDSKLASKFSGKWDDKIEKDKKGNFFIDQDYQMFWYLIQHLRNRANGEENYPENVPRIRDEKFYDDDFYRMVEHYGLTDALYPVRFEHHISNYTESLTSKKIHAIKFSTFSGHTRRIKSYQVTLGDVQWIKIGWCHIDAKPRELDDDAKVGAGDIRGTIALDVIRSCLLVDSNSTSVDRLEYSKGTVVRSEDFGRVWYVNGSHVAGISEEQWNEFDARQGSRRCSGYPSSHAWYIPFISVKGDFEISAVVFDT